MTEHVSIPFALDAARRYYFVGVGGISMSALALMLHARGIRVGGSDAKDSALLDQLRARQLPVYVGHDAAHISHDDVLILSDAIKPDNPEWQCALEWGLPIYKRADVLGYLVNAGRGVAVSGTHGKTTTSGMLAQIFLDAGMDPTCLLGGELTALGGHLRLGSELMLVEACEAYESFLALRPEVALITNIEVDHLDHHGTPEHLFESFRQFLRQVRALAVLNGDDARVCAMTDLPPRAVTYGAGVDNTYRYLDVTLGAEPAFTLLRGEQALGRCTLSVPGLHNISNATGAAALALELGADFVAVQRALRAFPGMHRRFERIGRAGAAAVVDDYAHHPTEIRATLAAARQVFPGKVTAVFQPHLFSRTRDLLGDFAAALAMADRVLVLPIYAAREQPLPGVSHELLAARIVGSSVHVLASLDDAVALLTAQSYHDGDVILTLGAGDVDRIAHALVRGSGDVR